MQKNNAYIWFNEVLKDDRVLKLITEAGSLFQACVTLTVKNQSFGPATIEMIVQLKSAVDVFWLSVEY